MGEQNAALQTPFQKVLISRVKQTRQMSRASSDTIAVQKTMSQVIPQKCFCCCFVLFHFFKPESREGESPETLGRGRTSETPLLRHWKTPGPHQSFCEELSSPKVTQDGH